jgi:hypothetical protein
MYETSPGDAAGDQATLAGETPIASAVTIDQRCAPPDKQMCWLRRI